MNRRRLSRRDLIAGAAAMTGGVAAAGLPLSAQPGPALVDVHHHTVPPFWFEEVKDRIAAQGGGRIVPGWLGWSPQKALEEMDKNGVGTAILSISTPGIWFGDVAQSRRLARGVNEYAARMTADHKGRFGLFAALPAPDIDGSLAEIAFAFDQLRADGIGLLTSYGDKWLGDPVYEPILAELERRRAVVYVHPATPGCCSALMPHVPPFLTEFIQETNRAITSLMYSGSLARFRNIRWIFSHAGGTMPMLAGRVAQLGSLPALAAKVPDGVEAELKRLHYEIANSANRPAIAALTSLVPMSQIMFGSDYPLVPLPATANGLRGLELSPADLAAISRQNAVRLFPRLQ